LWVRKNQKIQKTDTRFPVETSGSPSPSYGGLALSQIGNDFVRLPSGRSLGEAKVKILEIGPLHNYLEKERREPNQEGITPV